MHVAPFALLPVKLYSFHLLVMSVLLLVPHLRRLLDFFVFNRPAAPADHTEPRFRHAGWHRAGRIAKYLVIGYTLYEGASARLERLHKLQQLPAHYGLYEVEVFQRDGVEPAADDIERWRRVVVNEWGGLAAFTVDNHRLRFTLEQDAEKKTFTLTPHGGKQKSVLTFGEPAPNTLTLEGELDGHTLSLRLRRVSVNGTFLLTSRGFHWVSEFPFNR